MAGDDTNEAQGRRLKLARTQAGHKSATAGWRAVVQSAKSKVSQTTYLQHENGTRSLAAQAPDYAEAFRVPVEWLVWGNNAPAWEGPTSDSDVRAVRVVGFVGAGDAAHYYDTAQGPFDEVLAPENATKSTVAAEVRGHSMGHLYDGWLVFFDEEDRRPPSELVGHVCVVKLSDGRLLVKRLHAARSADVFHLESVSEPTINDVEVEWAAKVTNMRPR